MDMGPHIGPLSVGLTTTCTMDVISKSLTENQAVICDTITRLEINTKLE